MMMRHLLVAAPLLVLPAVAQAQVFTETFEDPDLESRGWYDNTALEFADIGATPDSQRSLQFRFLTGQDEPVTGSAVRLSFEPTHSVLLSYDVRYSENWEGSNLPYHPHEFYFMTNVDGAFSPPATSHLTVYVEQNEGRPLMIFQDSLNIDVDRLREDLAGVSEERAVAGCNGSSDRYPAGDCYGEGRNWRNGKFFFADEAAFTDEPGPRYKADWHRVDAYVQLNTITDGQADQNGVLRYWIDGELVINIRDVVLRTAEHEDMRFNQFLIGPYMASSPVDQTFWIDNLTLDTTDRVMGGGAVEPTPDAGRDDAGTDGPDGETPGGGDGSGSGGSARGITTNSSCATAATGSASLWAALALLWMRRSAPIV